jgi:hypothetical protein
MFSEFRDARYPKLYWLNIDVALRDIFFRERTGASRIIQQEHSLSLEYCVLEGLGAVPNALTVGREGMDFDRFVVDISGYSEVEEVPSILEPRAPARMIWNNTNDRSPRLDIYIPNNLTRHLIELYVTKRIDKVLLSMQIAVAGNHSANLNASSDVFPLLNEAENLLFRRVQCDLLSVYTSLR